MDPIEDLVYGDTYIDINGELVLKKMPDNINNIGKCLSNTINHQSIFFKKRLFEDGSRYDCSYKICADWVFVNNAIIYKKCSTRHISLAIPIYDTNGASNSLELRIKDRKKYLVSNFDPDFLWLLEDYNRLNSNFEKFKNNKWVLIMLKIKKTYTKTIKRFL